MCKSNQCFQVGSMNCFWTPSHTTVLRTGCRPSAWRLQGIRVVLNDGAAHAVDSNEMAFRLAAIGGFRQAYAAANPAILEPIMKVGFSQFIYVSLA